MRILLIGALVVAGTVVLGWGAITLFFGRPDALTQLILSAVLGGSLSTIGLYVLRDHLERRKEAAWLKQHEVSITAVPVEVRTV